MSKSDSMKRITVNFPQTLLQEVDRLAERENFNRSEWICQVLKVYVQDYKKKVIRETMQQGYLEMGYINLNMASEAFEAEGEAEHTLVRLVSGV